MPASRTRPTEVRLPSEGRRRAAIVLIASVLSAVFLFGLMGCGPSAQGDGSGSAGSSSTNTPELTNELIYERINDTRVWEVPDEAGKGEPIVWNFDHDEPKEIQIVDKKIDGKRATIILDIKTGSAPGRRNQRTLAGQIRTEWELRTGWVLRRWEITDTENISMRYRNATNSAPQNSNSANGPPPPGIPAARE